MGVFGLAFAVSSFAADYVPPSTAVSKINSYRGYSELTKAAGSMDIDQYNFYLDIRKYGTTRHAGFGLGFERCVMYLTGMSNIRDVLPYPRTVKNCEL